MTSGSSESFMYNRINMVAVGAIGCGAEFVELVVGGRVIEMEVDTGACSSIISNFMYLDYFKQLKLDSVNKRFTSVTGMPLKCVGKIKVNVNKMYCKKKHMSWN